MGSMGQYQPQQSPQAQPMNGQPPESPQGWPQMPPPGQKAPGMDGPQMGMPQWGQQQPWMQQSPQTQMYGQPGQGMFGQQGQFWGGVPPWMQQPPMQNGWGMNNFQPPMNNQNGMNFQGMMPNQMQAQPNMWQQDMGQMQPQHTAPMPPPGKKAPVTKVPQRTAQQLNNPMNSYMGGGMPMMGASPKPVVARKGAKRA